MITFVSLTWRHCSGPQEPWRGAVGRTANLGGQESQAFQAVITAQKVCDSCMGQNTSTCCNCLTAVDVIAEVPMFLSHLVFYIHSHRRACDSYLPPIEFQTFLRPCCWREQVLFPEGTDFISRMADESQSFWQAGRLADQLWQIDRPIFGRWADRQAANIIQFQGQWANAHTSAHQCCCS